MNLLEAIKGICVKAIPHWGFYFDDRQLMNVHADNSVFPLVFFEEYREGNYNVEHWFKKTTRVQLYFCKLCQMQNNGTDREKLREEIEEHAIKPFIEAYNNTPQVFDRVNNWQFFTPPPRFDANEVSVMLQFDLVQRTC